MHLLRRRYGTKRVHINQVYQEYISDKNHTHMNGTCWSSLTGFALYLNQTGKACTFYALKEALFWEMGVT